MDSPSWMFTKALSHRQKVLRLFKRCMREPDNWYYDPLDLHFHKRVIRARFEETQNEKDIRVSRELLAKGCREFWDKHHPQPKAYPNTPYGIAWERCPLPSEEILDDYTYAEKEMFPYYFNKREALKKELLQHWDKIEEGMDEKLEQLQATPPPEKAIGANQTEKTK